LPCQPGRALELAERLPPHCELPDKQARFWLNCVESYHEQIGRQLTISPSESRVLLHWARCSWRRRSTPITAARGHHERPRLIGNEQTLDRAMRSSANARASHPARTFFARFSQSNISSVDSSVRRFSEVLIRPAFQLTAAVFLFLTASWLLTRRLPSRWRTRSQPRQTTELSRHVQHPPTGPEKHGL
jgi:hypothetical protein